MVAQLAAGRGGSRRRRRRAGARPRSASVSTFVRPEKHRAYADERARPQGLDQGGVRPSGRASQRRRGARSSAARTAGRRRRRPARPAPPPRCRRGGAPRSGRPRRCSPPRPRTLALGRRVRMTRSETDPGTAALAAQPEDLDGVAQVGEAVLVGDPLRPRLHRRPGDLHGLAAPPAHEVVVVVARRAPPVDGLARCRCAGRRPRRRRPAPAACGRRWSGRCRRRRAAAPRGSPGRSGSRRAGRAGRTPRPAAGWRASPAHGRHV